jgi:hypothetical protein
VTKADSVDGKTEWFLVGMDELKAGMEKLRKALFYIYNDTLVWCPPDPVVKLDEINQ